MKIYFFCLATVTLVIMVFMGNYLSFELNGHNLYILVFFKHFHSYL